MRRCLHTSFSSLLLTRRLPSLSPPLLSPPSLLPPSPPLSTPLSTPFSTTPSLLSPKKPPPSSTSSPVWLPNLKTSSTPSSPPPSSPSPPPLDSTPPSFLQRPPHLPPAPPATEATFYDQFGNGRECPGCGAFLQSKEPQAAGYVDKSLYGKAVKATKLWANEIKKLKEEVLKKGGSLDWRTKEEKEEEREVERMGGEEGEEGKKKKGKQGGERWRQWREKIVRRVMGQSNLEDMKYVVEYPKDFTTFFHSGGVLAPDLLTCRRCYRLEKYQELDPVSCPLPIEAEEEVAAVTHRSCVIVLVVDLFDINGSFINNFWDIVDRHRPERNKYNTKKTNYEMLEGGKGEEGRRERLPGRGEEERGWEGRGGGLVEERKGKKWLSKRDQKILDEGLKWQAWKHTIVVVGNKKDIMPIKGKWEEEKVRVWLKHYCEGKGVKPEKIILSSGKTGDGLQDLKRHILKMKKGRDVVVMGSVNSGKSTLMKRLLPMLKGEMKGDNWLCDVVSSPLPGTTVKNVAYKFEEKGKLYDTPGLISGNHLYPALTAAEIMHIIPKKKVKPVTYRMTTGKTIFLGGLVRIDIVDCPMLRVTCYTSSNVKVHCTTTERADELYKNQLGKLLVPPYSAGIPKKSINKEQRRKAKEKRKREKQRERKENQAREEGEEIELPEDIQRMLEMDDEFGEEVEKDFPKGAFAAHDPGRLSRLPDMVNFDVSTTGPPPIYARHTFSHPFVDLVFSGVGWVSLACAGPIQVKTHVLRGTGVFMRDPIIPLDTSKQRIIKHGKIREPVRMIGRKIDFELPLPHVKDSPSPGQELVGGGMGEGWEEEE